MRLIFLIIFSCLTLSLQAINVVIIGGGPAGLATAIEASYAGANVLIVEKRSAYTRNQTLFLFDYSLELLKKWDVSIPSMQIANLEGGQLMGVTKIKDLEEALAKRVHALGIHIWPGECFGIGDYAVNTVMISTEQFKIAYPYDILVGADGANSCVRDALGISLNVFGKADSIAAVIPLPYADKEAELPPATIQDDVFIERIFFPGGRVLVVQYPLDNDTVAHAPLNQQTLITEAQKAGWFEEAEWILKGKSFVTPQIPIVLQQATAFSDTKKSTILVGDAAATAPYCQAMGANTALKTAELAGKLFVKLMEDKHEDYSQFNAQMKETTDALIWDSIYLIK